MDVEQVALVLQHLGLETAHGQLGDLRGLLLQLDDLQCILLDRDVRPQDLLLVVQGHQLEVAVGDLGHQVRHHEVPAFHRSEIAEHLGLPGVAQLLPDVQLPRGPHVHQQIGHWLRKSLVLPYGQLLLHRTIARVLTHFLHTCGRAEVDERKILALARTHLGPGRFDLLHHHVQFLVVGQGGVDERPQVRIGEELLPRHGGHTRGVLCC